MVGLTWSGQALVAVTNQGSKLIIDPTTKSVVSTATTDTSYDGGLANGPVVAGNQTLYGAVFPCPPSKPCAYATRPSDVLYALTNTPTPIGTNTGYQSVSGLFTVGSTLFGVMHAQFHESGGDQCGANGVLITLDTSGGTGQFVRCLSFDAAGATGAPSLDTQPTPTPTLTPSPTSTGNTDSSCMSAIPSSARARNSITEFPINTINSAPYGITMGPDGNLWFTESNCNKIGRITPIGSITEFTIPSSASDPTNIVAGPDGNLWFTEQAANKIGRITVNGSITEYGVPTSQSSPYGITTGSDGNLWFTEVDGNQVGRITPSGSITEYSVPTSQSLPYGITAGPDGALWFTEADGNKIGRITTAGTITEYSFPYLSFFSNKPDSIAVGPDGNLWFTEFAGNKVGRITPDGSITEFGIPTSQSDPLGITAGPDAALWFAEVYGNKIGRITTDGHITEFSVPTSDSTWPTSITSGPDGTLWFTESYKLGNAIGRLVIPPSPSATPLPTSTNSPTVKPTPTPIPVAPTTTPAVLPPGGLWISPNDGQTFTSAVHFAAHAYPTNAGGPPIREVDFTAW